MERVEVVGLRKREDYLSHVKPLGRSPPVCQKAEVQKLV